MKNPKKLATALLALITLASICFQVYAEGVPVLPAAKFSHPDKGMLLSAAKAGNRVVVVGEQGLIILSDDSGKTFRQAKSVPVSFTLTSVTFIDEKRGWAAGHGGTILHTVDGGETWVIQRLDTQIDQPLFSIFFRDEKVGFAVGLWSLVLKTENGGESWSTISLPPPPGHSKADNNLNAIFGSSNALFIASEKGAVIKSNDDGKSWSYNDTSYEGSWWAGTVQKDNSILVGGMRGNLYRSENDGGSWSSIVTNSKKSITGFLVSQNTVFAYGLDGLLICSVDGGKSFKALSHKVNAVLTSVVNADNQLLLFSKGGYAGAVPAVCK